ncbi:hypothetical protein FW755_05660 [Lonepinella koalarum]|uniref:Outer membrane protein n=1 Tax=Lonepinella koalarum TaxID=53417 RepID=A0A4R1KZR7_9PAST|nr:hypothetical protein [Lonepinella koalarum]MDH2925940.1 hypothetical protein [Lonepinella koalarum]TCK71092.1 hypothetical protein EV692_0147 [Lonepinella koalarum]TFJ90821.1 hypothetical protein E0709_00730 [Lonepinella koalarum]TYG34605.1 hypothetical protein FW755_05660 [Lonepinella koalarum]
MKFFKFITALCALTTASLAQAVDYNIKYSSNYLMPAYVHFSENGTNYAINARINVPLYNIQFISSGTHNSRNFTMFNYKDTRNKNTYALAKINGKQIEYGKVKGGLKKESVSMPVYDLFTMAFQLTYYDKLPVNFIITNGKKLYPMNNVFVKKFEQNVNNAGKTVKELTYTFNADGKDITVKKYEGEQFPRYLKYARDGDNYELTFSELIK